jgi:hypothetical protein
VQPLTVPWRPWINGWFGGFLPLIATSVVAGTGNLFAGLIFPIAVAAMSFVVAFFVKETFRIRIWDEVEAKGMPAAAPA